MTLNTSNLTFAAGEIFNTFTIAGVADGIVDGSKTVTITASATGYGSASSTLTVMDIDVAKMVEIAATSILESGATTGTITLSQPAPTNNFIVNLLNSDNTEVTAEHF